MLKKWLKGIAGTFFFLMSAVHASGLVPPVSCSRPTKVCLDPARAAAPRICSQIALTPVTWTSQRKYKDRLQFQLSPHHCVECLCFVFFPPHENNREGLSLSRSVTWRRKSQSWKVTVWPTVTLNPSSNRRTHTWYTGKRTFYTSNRIIILYT